MPVKIVYDPLKENPKRTGSRYFVSSNVNKPEMIGIKVGENILSDATVTELELNPTFNALVASTAMVLTRAYTPVIGEEVKKPERIPIPTLNADEPRPGQTQMTPDAVIIDGAKQPPNLLLASRKPPY